MTERWWRRRRRFTSRFGDFFEETDKAGDMDSVIRKVFTSRAERERARRRYAQLEDTHYTCVDGSQVSEEYRPLVDVFADETNVVVVAELPGIDKDTIEVNATENKVTISVDAPKHGYYQELNLPAKVDPKSSSASYKNGVLEVRLKIVGESPLLR